MVFKKLQNISELKGNFIVFKHSNICPVSIAAYKELENIFFNNILIYLVIVQENRALCKEIEEKFSIKHESPQLIIKNNNKIDSFSHFKIKFENIKNLLVVN